MAAERPEQPERQEPPEQRQQPQQPQQPHLLTIGAFSRASRLSPKALRLYDELGLLTPAQVDPATGYRYYAPDQLGRARLVAWLRRIGMPLARIRVVCASNPTAAAQEIRSFWAGVETDFAARRDLAAFLVDQLSRNGKEPDGMSTTKHPLAIRYAALSDSGLVRPSNQDAAYADARLLAVADGFGEAGASASAAAIDVLKQLPEDPEGNAPAAGGLLNVLEDAIEQARRAVEGISPGAESDDQAAGTTLTAMFWTGGSQLALVHIGDSRAYVLRDGELFQITHDHTVVQAMIDEGRISPEEAASHPQRALLARALGSGADPGSRPDLSLQDARAGDRYLLCSDGLTGVVPTDQLQRTLASVAAPDAAVRELVGLANAAGGPDNVSCVVADVVRMDSAAA